MPSQIMQQQDTLSYPLKAKLSSEQAPIEKLPTELLRLGTEALVQDSHPYDVIQHDLLSCLLTSHKLHETAIPLVYRNVKFSKASTFQKFLAQLSRYPPLGKNVQRLDLSELTGEHVPTAETLERCLSLTPKLREFLAPPEIDLDEVSLRRLLCDLPQLQLLNFPACSSVSFNEAFGSIFEEDADTNVMVSSSITHLNLHGCSSLPCHVFEDLLPQLPKLEHLDVSGTNITDDALASISSTAKLTHINISNCPFLSGRSVAQTISTHPSFKTSLISLNAETKPAHADATFSEEDLSRLLPNLPSTLKSLNLKRSIMTPEHITHLQKLSTHLEELHVGTDLRLEDLESLFVPPQAQTLALSDLSTSIQDPTLSPPIPASAHSAQAEKSDAVLSHMEQAVAVCKIRRLLNSIPLPNASSTTSSKLRSLDISSMSIFQQRKITNSVLLGNHSLPLQRIEVSEEVFLMCKVLGRVCTSVGWGVVWDGRRCEILRGSTV